MVKNSIIIVELSTTVFTIHAHKITMGANKCITALKIGGHAIFEYQLKAFEWADEIRMVVGCASERVIQEVAAINSNIIFVDNIDFANTSTLQSNFLGARNVEGNALLTVGNSFFVKSHITVSLE